MFRKLYQQFCNLKTDISVERIDRQFLLSLLIAVLIVACNHASVPETAPSSNCRTVNHVAGKTCVPIEPKRLIVLGIATMGDALALGVKPVGTILYFDKNNSPSYLEGKLDGIETVGLPYQPNLETILTLNPDLIISMYPDQAPYEQLSQIAPTVVDDWKGFPSWKEHFNFVARVLGKTEKAEQVWAHYERRIQDLRTALGDNYQDIEVSFVHICCGSVALDVKNSFSGIILEDIGLSRPPVQDVVADSGIVSLSEELLMNIDGDIIFVAVDREDDEAEKLLKQLQQKPLWNNLRVVQQGRVYPVNYPTWRGGNPLAANAIIDDLFKYLVEEKPIK